MLKVYFIKVFNRIFFFFLLVVRAQAQLYSLDTPMDPRTIALSQSTVADLNMMNWMDSNPAGLSAATGFHAFYASRRADVLFLEEYLNQIGIVVKTSFGNIGFGYKRFDKYTLNVTSPTGPDVIGLERLRDHTMVLSFSRSLGDYLAWGVSFKRFDFGTELISGSPSGVRSEPAYMADIGAVYKISGLVAWPLSEDVLSLGISLQNFGSDFTMVASPSAPFVAGNTFKPPRFFHAGLCYSVGDKDVNQSFFHRILLMAEYRRFFETDYFTIIAGDFFGVGTEIDLLQILFLRFGGSVQPYDNVFGKKGRLSLRYGAGVQIDFERYFADAPFSLKFGYAYMPLNKEGSFVLPIHESVSAVGLEINIHSVLF